MARSIHTTRRSMQDERRFEWSDGAGKDKKMTKLDEALERKRSLKSARQQKKIQMTLTDDFRHNIVPIQIVDCGEAIHYPAMPDDLLEVARRLPAGALAGVESISLWLGKEYLEEEYECFGERKIDPYTGRLSNEPGPVYEAPVLGLYKAGSCKIFLFAYVYESQIRNRTIVEALLRFNMLTTFVHEVAHHEDRMRRSGNRRCFGLNEDRCEEYAENQAAVWQKEIVLEYLLEAYPKEYRELERWMCDTSGIELSLTVLMEEPGARVGGLVRCGMSQKNAVCDMVYNGAAGKSLREIRFIFAEDLHLADYYEECLRIVKRLVAEQEDDTEALALQADTLVHLERFAEAEAAAKSCLRLDEENAKALDVLCDVYRSGAQWNELSEVAERGLVKANGWSKNRFLNNAVIANLQLQNERRAQELVERFEEEKMIWRQNKAAWAALVDCCSERCKSGLQQAKALLQQERVYFPVQAIAKGIIVKWEDGTQVKLSERENNVLEYYGIAALLRVK